MVQQFHEPVLNFLANARGGEGVHAADIVGGLNIPPQDRAAFDAAVEDLIREGRVVLGAGRALALPPLGARMLGVYRQTQRGFGFVIPDQPNAHGDLFIPIGENLDAVSGDFVAAKVIVRDKYARDRRSIFGRITEILHRATNRCVGVLAKQHGKFVVLPDGNIFKAPIDVQDATAKNAVEGDKVVLELLRFPNADHPGQGVIMEVLGPHGEPEVELKSVIRQFDLPLEFPPAVIEQARQAAVNYRPTDYPEREDLSGDVIVTIDPVDARDFDDAISLKALRGRGVAPPQGSRGQDDDARSLMEGTGEAVWELGVHIADVSAFVPVESAMDMEARARGNSTYFPKFVIPMLPEILSNGVCSLQENQPRLTKTAFIRYDAAGSVVSTRFANTIIKSRKRLTYQQAQAVIDDAKGQGKPYTKGLLESPVNPNVPEVAGEVRELLVNMDRLARAIQQRRLVQGMIVLDLPQVELVMDPEGRVIDAKPEDDSFTHKIIEMFMVEANEAVSRFLTRAGLPVLRRVHADPDAPTAEQVRQFVTIAGKRVPKVLDRKAIQELLDSVRGTPIAYAVHLAVLKTFSTAEYSPMELGHYALASENYAHFTSPIRRYADLVIHRLFDAAIRKRGQGSGARGQKKHRHEHRDAPPAAIKNPKSEITNLPSGLAGERRGGGLMPATLSDTPDYQTLVQLGKHLSFTERRSSDAERELREVKVLQLMAEHIGDIIDGVVTGVTGFGVFVQSTRFLVEGMIRIADLPDDFWQFDERSGCLRGNRTGRRIALGDRARAQIVTVNIPARQLELRLTEHGSSIGGETGLHRVEPRKAPKPHAEHTREEGESPVRKKNLEKRLARKEAANREAQAARSRRQGGGGGRGRGGRRGRRR